MFDLELAISEWRRQLTVGGIKAPEVLSELESHLREDIERQICSDASQQQWAFETAVQRIGPASALKTEFARASATRKLGPGALAGIACASLAGIYSLMLVAPLATAHAVNWTERLVGLAAFAAAVLSWRYLPRTILPIPSPWVRMAASVGCCLAALLWMMFFISQVLPGILNRAFVADGQVGWLLGAILWAMALVAALGSIAYGLERAARIQHPMTAL